MYKRIAVIDTGCNSKYIGKNPIFGYSIVIKNGCAKKALCYNDYIGHGTAVTCIIDQQVRNSQIVVIKIDEKYCRKHGIARWLFEALKYIYENEHFDVVNISLGYTARDDGNSVERICDKIRKKGTIIVSAFDNNGIVSYPAMFHSVIGVDSSPLLDIGKYIYVDKNVNVIASIKRWNLPTACGEYCKSYGNSFLAPEFSAKIYNWLSQGICPDEIEQILQREAWKIVDNLEEKTFGEKRTIDIRKAITYPFNKEISTLSRFEDQLNFDIIGYYDHPLLGKVGTDIGAAFQCANSHKIKSITDLNWSDDFDTVILSHVETLSQILQRNIVEQVIEACLFYHKNLFLFDEDDCFVSKAYSELVALFEEKGLWIHKPSKMTNLNLQWGGKLFNTSCPVLCVAGTDSAQGKFTLQIMLRKLLKKQNVKVSNFGTEPSSELFGFEGVYTFGYNADMPYAGWKNIIAVNHTLHQLDEIPADIIITGLQSRTIAPNAAAFKSYPIRQQEFIVGCSPDAYVLCVNTKDPFNYIKRTIKYLESVFPSKVIALCMNDVSHSSKWHSPKVLRLKYTLMLRKRVYSLSSEKSLEKLSKYIIRYYQ